MNCYAPARRRATCPCGGRNSVSVAVEYTSGDGQAGQAGGRFCYFDDALIEIKLPEGVTPVKASIYDLHESDEIIRITFSCPKTPNESQDGGIPGMEGDDPEGKRAPWDGEAREHATLATSKPTTPGP